MERGTTRDTMGRRMRDSGHFVTVPLRSGASGQRLQVERSPVK